MQVLRTIWLLRNKSFEGATYGANYDPTVNPQYHKKRKAYIKAIQQVLASEIDEVRCVAIVMAFGCAELRGLYGVSLRMDSNPAIRGTIVKKLLGRYPSENRLVRDSEIPDLFYWILQTRLALEDEKHHIVKADLEKVENNLVGILKGAALERFWFCPEIALQACSFIVDPNQDIRFQAINLLENLWGEAVLRENGYSKAVVEEVTNRLSRFEKEEVQNEVKEKIQRVKNLLYKAVNH